MTRHSADSHNDLQRVHGTHARCSALLSGGSAKYSFYSGKNPKFFHGSFRNFITCKKSWKIFISHDVYMYTIFKKILNFFLGDAPSCNTARGVTKRTEKDLKLKRKHTKRRVQLDLQEK